MYFLGIVLFYIFAVENIPHIYLYFMMFLFLITPTGQASNQLHFSHHYSTKTCILTKVFMCNILLQGLYGKYLAGKQVQLKLETYMMVKSSPFPLHLMHKTGFLLTDYPYKIISIVSRSLTTITYF